MIDTKKLRELADKAMEGSEYHDGPLTDAIMEAIQSVHETCDEVDALRGELDKRRWVPVAERLPEDGECVLAVLRGTIAMAVWLRGEWRYWDTGERIDVTHWMPPPEPPEVER